MVLEDDFLTQDMSSAILLLSVLIHCEFMPSGELIKSKQKKQTSNQSSDLGYSASMVGPALCGCIVGNVENYRVGILCYICCGYHVR
jgi:hypothetical protein